jgi:hypothetical protein
MHDEHDIVAELRDGGSGLWSSVECEVRRDCVVVYARLVAHPRVDLAHALAKSEQVLNSVMARRLEGGRSWLAAVQWSERLCKTIHPQPAAHTSH